MKQINSLEEFSDLINQLTPREFEEYVYRLLVASDVFKDIKLWSLIDNRQVDILAVEQIDSTLSNEIQWAIEVKKYKSIISVDIIDGLFGKWQDLKNYNSDVQLLLVAPSGLSSIAAERAKKFGIKVWLYFRSFCLKPKVEICHCRFLMKNRQKNNHQEVRRGLTCARDFIQLFAVISTAF